MPEEEGTPSYHSALKVSVTGESPNEGGDVVIGIAARGALIGITATQGEGDEEQTVEMLLSLSDFQRFLMLAQALLHIVVSELPPRQEQEGAELHG